MSLKHILLGMLAEPKSGYDLTQEFDKSLRNFWNAELSQIYPQLQKLEDEGLLTSKLKPSPEGPPRRVYRRSYKGKRELVKWLRAGPEYGKARISYLAQVYFLPQLDETDDMLDFMHQLRSDFVDRQTKYQEIEREWKRCDPRYPNDLPDDDFSAHRTLALGLKQLTATLEWCDESIAHIEARAAAVKRRKRA